MRTSSARRGWVRGRGGGSLRPPRLCPAAPPTHASPPPSRAGCPRHTLDPSLVEHGPDVLDSSCAPPPPPWAASCVQTKFCRGGWKDSGEVGRRNPAFNLTSQ